MNCPSIITETHLLPPLDPSSPSFLLHITRLKGSLLLWVGAANSDGRASSVNLGKEWSCGMPAVGTRPPVATPLFRSGSSDIALGLSSRIAKRLSIQILLSLDLPSSLTSTRTSLYTNQNAQFILLDLEKKIIGILLKLMKEEKTEKILSKDGTVEAPASQCS
ncbi:hypothetical protein [Phaffia rhodozyma]|uniref:Proteasome assembly chaperone 4 n=1 Tax=Phaffia rhodozyma TaxID=264483 RepID=A0A0F7SPH7_PHARH|nr:hypothetical protein [Phaffia rhodozyma]